MVLLFADSLVIHNQVDVCALPTIKKYEYRSVDISKGSTKAFKATGFSQCSFVRSRHFIVPRYVSLKVHLCFLSFIIYLFNKSNCYV